MGKFIISESGDISRKLLFLFSFWCLLVDRAILVWVPPLHDLIFHGTNIHDVYLRVWTYARITRAFLGAMKIALPAKQPFSLLKSEDKARKKS